MLAVSKFFAVAVLVDEIVEKTLWLKTQFFLFFYFFLLILPCDSDGFKNKAVVMYL